MVVLGVLAGDRRDPALAEGWSIIRLMLSIPMIWISLATYAKRWHDADFSGWMVLALFIPLFNVAVAIACGCLPGTAGPNQYGPDPRSESPQPESAGFSQARAAASKGGL